MKVVCDHCGLPFSAGRTVPGRAVYCCSGCALATRVPFDAKGRLPVNAALGAALGLGFAFFNQGLFWLLGVLLAKEPNGAANAGRFLFASHAAGAAVWVALAAAQWKVGARRISDIEVTLATGLLHLCAFKAGEAWAACLANGLLAMWALRGWGRRKI